MKEKILKITILIIIFLLLSPTSLDATSGACSSHKGVDCGKGRQSNGMVYCIDGWTDSMVEYDFMIECKNNSRLSKIDKYIEQGRTVVGVYPDYSEEVNKCMSQSNERFMIKWEACIDIAKVKANELHCPLNSIKEIDYDLTQWCICNEGYYEKDNECKKGEKLNLYRELVNAARNLSKEVNDSFNRFEKTRNCQRKFGKFSQWSGKLDSNNSLLCECKDGFKWNIDKSQCIINCNDGYIMVGADCISHTENCKKYYGQNVYGAKGNDNNSNCYCNSGYDWDSNRKNCIKQTSVIEKEKNSTGKLDKNLVNRLSGYILIQSELDSTLWYLNPKDKKRYLLNSSTDLLKLIQNTAIFADSKLMAAYTKNPAEALGRFILDTKNSKKYYVNPNDKKLYELENYEWGYLKLKSLGLGITNTDIRKIGVGEIK